jgi:DNA-directed RNA polymerase specialized sigma24 family protein
VLLLYAVDGYSHDEIAALLDIKAVTSRKRLSRAKQWIVSRFDVEGNEMILKKSSDYEMD